MLVDLGRGVYVEDFEAPFLERTAEFYQVRWGSGMLAYCDAPPIGVGAVRRLSLCVACPAACDLGCPVPMPARGFVVCCACWPGSAVQ